MLIRDATESDLPAIVDIFNAAVPTRISTAQLQPVSVEERLPWFRQHSPDWHPFWVAEIDGNIAGWLSFQSFYSRCAYQGTAEVSVYVHDDFRRRGVARALLEQAIARSLSLGIDVIMGMILGHNEPSLQLFASLGFQCWGTLPGVARLEDTERDLVIMGLRVPSHSCSYS